MCGVFKINIVLRSIVASFETANLGEPARGGKAFRQNILTRLSLIEMHDVNLLRCG